MALRQLNITDAARRDIAAIHRFTRRHWSRSQADGYRARLAAAFDRLLSFPEAGREWRPGMSSLRCLPCGSHLVFYLITSGTLDIVRILHERMDARHHVGLHESPAAAYAP